MKRYDKIQLLTALDMLRNRQFTDPRPGLSPLDDITMVLTSAVDELLRARPVVHAALKQTGLYDPTCGCDACREDRASGLVDATSAYRAATTA